MVKTRSGLRLLFEYILSVIFYSMFAFMRYEYTICGIII